MNLKMSNRTSLHDTKSGKQFPDFCFALLLLLISYSSLGKERNGSTEKKTVLHKACASILPKPPLAKYLEIRLPSILFKKNEAIPLDSIQEYDYEGKISYLKMSTEISSIVKMLADNPNIILELSAHCSSDEKNPTELSKQRAEKVQQMLIIKGIDKERLVPKGWGVSKLKITDIQIAKAKTKEEKEALHQINRRVVFKILSWDYKKN